MAFKTRKEDERFDHSRCAQCGQVFAGVYSFDKHRQAHLVTFIREMNQQEASEYLAHYAGQYFTEMGGLLVANTKVDAYQAMRDKAATARAGRK